MQNILITGANRGIGFELTRQYAEAGGARVFAACRAPDHADQLNDLSRAYPSQVTVLQLDVNEGASIQAAVEAVRRHSAGLDTLINNAGIGGDDHARVMGQLTAAELSKVIGTNAVAPVIVTQACRALLQKSGEPRVVMISSGLGSLQRTSGTSYAYRMSKAALNMAARVLAFDDAMAGIITVTVNPGWVKTDMGGPNAALEPEESARQLRALIAGLSAADNGKFFQYDGGELPW